jgi:hypothetical protein
MRTVSIAIIALCLFSACSKKPEQTKRPEIEQDIHIVDQLVSSLDGRRSWASNVVKIHLKVPEVVVTSRPPTGSPNVVHAWEHNDYSVPMIRIDSGEALYQISKEEFSQLKKLNEKVSNNQIQNIGTNAPNSDL